MVRLEYGIWALAAGAMLVGCGPDPGPVGWIDADASVIRCTSAGRDRMPPVLLDLPAPKPPTGLYARQLDPMALDDLGFQRDTVACAMLMPPDNAGDTGADALREARVAAGRAAVTLVGMCACEATAQLDARPLLLACVDRPTRRKCDVSDSLEKIEEILTPVYDALAKTRAPLLHWRLVGKTDRPGWFERQQSTLIERHEGGSTIYTPGQAIPKRTNGPLLEAMLAEPNVVAVARQNSGRALLVVREIDKTLVLDHFAYAAVGDTITPLLPFLDNATIDRYRTMLAKPTDTRKLRLEPGKGNMIEVDVSLLETLDASIRAGASLADMEAESPRELPDRRVSAITAQAPFGKQGQQLDVKVELTSTGEQWAALLTDADLMPSLSELELEPVEIAEPDSPIPYVLAGTEFERSVVYGLEGVPGLMSELESRYPGAVAGTARAWSFTMPESDLEGVAPPGTTFTGVRNAFAERVFQIEVTVTDEGRALQATVKPK